MQSDGPENLTHMRIWTEDLLKLSCWASASEFLFSKVWGDNREFAGFQVMPML